MSKTLLQINVTANWGSHGKIAEDIGKLAIHDGWDSYIAYGRGNPTSRSNLIHIGSRLDMFEHGLETRLFDNHGLASRQATKSFCNKLLELNPTIVHLHNIHGYYLNYPQLFKTLKEWGAPVVWTLHDCWPFTGHCAYYDFVKCDRWKTICHDCPQLRSYPVSVWRDRSVRNYKDKQDAFLGGLDITFVPVSNWLKEELSKSFLKHYPSLTIHNGIDVNVFHPMELKKDESNKKVVLGVASVWDKRKGLDEFVKLRKVLSDDYVIILVGLSQDQISSLPDGITGIRRTENVEQLVALYNKADVFVNPTLEDNFPTTNLEALACGTPVITYRTGGSPEAIDGSTGIVVDYQDIDSLSDKVVEICTQSPFSSEDCRARAVRLYDKNKVFKQYLELYDSLLSRQK